MPSLASFEDSENKLSFESKCEDDMDIENTDEWFVGKECDVLEADRIKCYWCPAEIIEIDRERRRVKIWFTNWSHKFDEWLPFDSDRLAKRGTHFFYDEGRPRKFKVGQRIEVFDEHPTQQKFSEAEVVELDKHRVKVHFKGFVAKWDEWLSVDSDRIRQFRIEKQRQRRSGTLSSAGILPSSSSEFVPVLGRHTSFVNNYRQAKRVIAAEDPRYAKYRNALEARGLRIQPVEGDGNCLFRSIAHQIYGDDEKPSAGSSGAVAHQTVRRTCMDYMETQRSHFEPFVQGLRMFDDLGGSSNKSVSSPENDHPAEETKSAQETSSRQAGVSFQRYVAEMRRDAVWGGDPEITAMCEMYDRPAEIYCFCPVQGAKLLRSFHEARRGRKPPIRVSFYGGGHYDSIVGNDTISAHLSSSPGVAEERRIGFANSYSIGNSSRHLGAVPMNGGEGNSTSSITDELELAKQESRRIFDAQSQTQDIETALWLSLRESESANNLERALEESSKEADAADNARLQFAVAQSENAMLAAALAESAETAGVSGLLRQNDDADAATLERVLLESARQRELEEEADLQRALRASAEGVDENAIASLIAAGFERNQCIQALANTAGDPNAAMTLLLAASDANWS
eukprot:g2994.t1